MKLYVMFTGHIKKTGAPVLAYLIRTADYRILVDTGFPRDWGPDRLGARENMELRPGEDMLSHLADLCVNPATIDYVICTHLDPDHAGNHDAFRGAEFVIQRRHLEWARSPDAGRLQATRARWDHPDARYRLVDGDTAFLPGIELIESSGHVPGHQSVLVRLPRGGPILMAADAIPTMDALDPETRPIYPFDMDETSVRASTRKLVAIAHAENAQIICGHDPDASRTLRRAPHYYE